MLKHRRGGSLCGTKFRSEFLGALLPFASLIFRNFLTIPTSRDVPLSDNQDLLAPVEIIVSLTVEASQSEIQELRVAADYQSTIQSIVVKAFAETEDGSASQSSAVAERQLVTIEVRRNT